jgi:hypothetical protein
VAGGWIQLYKQRVEDHHVRVWLGKCVGVTNVPKGGSWGQGVEVVGKQDPLVATCQHPVWIRLTGLYEDKVNAVRKLILADTYAVACGNRKWMVRTRTLIRHLACRWMPMTEPLSPYHVHRVGVIEYQNYDITEINGPAMSF